MWQSLLFVCGGGCSLCGAFAFMNAYLLCINSRQLSTWATII